MTAVPTMYRKALTMATREELLAIVTAGDFLDLRPLLEPVADALEGAVAGLHEPDHVDGLWRTEFYMPEEIPFPSPVRVGISGWWQITDSIACHVGPAEAVGTPDDKAFGVRVAVIIDEPSESLAVRLHPMVGYISWSDAAAWGTVLDYYPIKDDPEGAVWFSQLLMRLALAASIIAADPAVIHSTPLPPKLVRASRKRGKPLPERVSTIDLPGLRYERGAWRSDRVDTHGKAWHMVRGHWRRLTSSRYVAKQGQRVWVRSHARGDKRNGLVVHNYTTDGAT